MNFKKVLFTISILSFGLVLSACNNEDTNVEEQENIQSQLEESQEIDQEEQVNNEETEEQINEETEELDINRWREYENEYFDVKFKYHNNWYFQRDNLNQENYIAVYGFSPSAEELQSKEYAIKLFILNSDDSFTEDFNLIKEKEGNNKKYILVSNNNEYQEILNMMFENLEIVGDKEVEENIASLNTYVNEELGLQFEYPEGWIVREENTDYNNRIYIENQVNKNYNIGNYPEDFLGMWIDYREPSSETLSYQKQIDIYNGLSTKKRLLKSDSVNIYTYEFAHDPDSERSGVGPYLVAIWEDDTYIYNAQTIGSDNEDNNETKVRVLKQILSTFKFTN